MPHAVDRDQTERHRAKQWAAVSSMLAAVLLTAAKLAVALLSGSLGILSEALHSGIDLVGTVLSFAAVRVSSKPPDANHPYGHAKFESLAALFAVVLLAVTALGILREAAERVLSSSGSTVPSVNILSFGVLLLSIFVDFSRSRYLSRVAEKHGSQALAADAAHFATDLYSSIAVLVGLIVVAVGSALHWPSIWLAAADATAGAVVAVIILGVASKLALRAVAALTDSIPPNLLSDVVSAARGAPGTLNEPSARVRFIGDQAYADLSIDVSRGLSLERSQQVSNDVIGRVQSVLPHADVVVHTQPVAPAQETAVEAAIIIAARLGLSVHHVRAFQTEAGLRLDMHMEVPSTMSLADAHQEADLLERELRKEISSVADVQVHIEPRHEDIHHVRADAPAAIARQVEAAASAYPDAGIHNIEVLQSSDGYVVTVHCYLPDDLPIAAAHARTADIEKQIRERVSGIYRVTVHPEPAGSKSQL